MELGQEQLRDALKGVIDPNTGRDLVSTRSVREIH